MIRHIGIIVLFTVLFAAIFQISLRAQESNGNSGRYIDIKEVTSPGGISAWLVEDHTLPIIAIRFAFKGIGAKLDPAEKQGLARMVSNTLDEGAGPYNSQDFQKNLNDHSISLHFSASRDDFTGTLRTLSHNKTLAFSLLKLALTEPRFDEEPVARMRAHNMARIRGSLSDPEWIAARIMNDVAYENHPYAMNSGGTLTTLAAITQADLRGFADDYFSRDRLLVTAVGDITEAELKRILDDIFGSLPQSSQTENIADFQIKNAGTLAFYEKDIPQTIISIAMPGISREDPDYYKAMIMNYILGGAGFGSRLMETLREERGLTYGVSSWLGNSEHTETLMINTSTGNESTGQVMDLIRQEMKMMAEEPVRDEELARAQSYLIGSLPLNMTSSTEIASLLLGLRLDNLPTDYFTTRERQLRAVTKKDVQAIAKRLLQPESLTTVLVGRPKDIQPTHVIETLPNVE